MTIAQIKEIYENIFNICKKYEDAKRHISENNVYENYYTISIDGSSYDFTVNIVFHAANNDPYIEYSQSDISIKMLFNDNGISVNYSIERKKHSYSRDEMDAYDNNIKTEIKDLELIPTLTVKDQISDAEISEFKVILKKIDKQLSHFSEDFEFATLISELKNYVTSV